MAGSWSALDFSILERRLNSAYARAARASLRATQSNLWRRAEDPSASPVEVSRKSIEHSRALLASLDEGDHVSLDEVQSSAADLTEGSDGLPPPGP